MQRVNRKVWYEVQITGERTLHARLIVSLLLWAMKLMHSYCGVQARLIDAVKLIGLTRLRPRKKYIILNSYYTTFHNYFVRCGSKNLANSIERMYFQTVFCIVVRGASHEIWTPFPATNWQVYLRYVAWPVLREMAIAIKFQSDMLSPSWFWSEKSF